MKNQLLAAATVALTLMFAGCSQENSSALSSTGKISPKVDLTTQPIAVEAEISRAAYSNVSVSDLSLRLESEDGSYLRTWDSVDKFPNDEEFKIGNYTLTAFYGSESDEGFERPYFHASETFKVEANKTSSVSLKALLANAIVKIVYTDDFKNYMESFQSTIKSAIGNTNHVVGEDETRDLHVIPGDVSLNIIFTKPNGKSGEINVANFEAKKQHRHTITIGLSSAIGSSESLSVSIDDNVSQTEEVSVDISDEVLDAEAPTLVVAGRGGEENPTFSVLGSVAPEGGIKVNVIAMGGLKKIGVTTTSATLLNAAWPQGEVDLMEATETQKSNMTKCGFAEFGVWDNPDRMAVLDFTKVGEYLADGESAEFTVDVTDKLGKTCDPVKFNVTSKGVTFSIGTVSYAGYYESEYGFDISYDGYDYANKLTYQMKQKNGIWKNLTPKSVSAKGDNVYHVAFNIPADEYDYQFRAEYNESDKFTNSVNTRQDPGFSIVCNENNSFAKFAYIGLNNVEAGADIVLEMTTDGGETWNKVSAEAFENNKYLKLSGLAATHNYTVRAKVNGKYALPGSFTTESTPSIPDSGFDDWESTKKGDYQYLWVVDNGTPWATVNDLTISQSGSGSGSGLNTGGCAYKATSGTIPANGRSTYSNSYGGTFGTSTHGDGHTVGNANIHTDKARTGNNAALIRTVGYGSGNNAGSGTGNPASGFATCRNVAAGELYLGKYNNGAQYSGYKFASRPTAISFYYKYTSYGSSGDYGDCEIILKDASGNVIATKSCNLTAQSSYTKQTFTIDYPYGTAKCANIMIRFKSSAKPGLTNNSTWLYGPGNKNVSGGEYVGSELYIDDLTIEY